MLASSRNVPCAISRTIAALGRFVEARNIPTRYRTAQRHRLGLFRGMPAAFVNANS